MVLYKYTTENQLKYHLISNFEKYFDFSFLTEEFKMKAGRIDIVGENDSTIYVIELKRDFVTAATISQLRNYLDAYITDKKLIGIAAAPKIAPDVDLASLPENVWIKELNGVEYVPNPDTKVKVSISIDEDVWMYICRLAEQEDRTVSSMINRVLRQRLLHDQEKKEGE